MPTLSARKFFLSPKQTERRGNTRLSTRNPISLGDCRLLTGIPPPLPTSKYYLLHRLIGASSQAPGRQAGSQGRPARHRTAVSWEAGRQASSEGSLPLMVAGKLNAKRRRRRCQRRRREWIHGQGMGGGPGHNILGVTGGPRRIILLGENYHLILRVQSLVSLWPLFG